MNYRKIMRAIAIMERILPRQFRVGQQTLHELNITQAEFKDFWEGLEEIRREAEKHHPYRN